MIPHGLKINNVPLVTSELIPRHNFLKQWDSTLRKASRLLLKHPKNYRKSVLINLKNEIMKEEAIINNRHDYMYVERTSAIHHYAKNIFQHQET